MPDDAGRAPFLPHAEGPDPADLEVGLLVRTRRRALNISQEALADACGVSFQQVQKYENGANRISISRLVRIARALKVRPAWFFDQMETDGGEVRPSAEAAFFRSAEGQRIAAAAPRLAPEIRRAIADLAEALARPAGA